MNIENIVKTVVYVNHLPEKSEECPFAEYIQMTSKHKCMFQQGMYSRCNLECNMECKYLSLLPFPSTY